IIRRRVDDLARPVHVLRLIARGGVRHAQSVGQHEAIASTGAGAIGHELMPSCAETLHWHRLAIELNLDCGMGRRPQPEPDFAVGEQLGAEWHTMRARRHCRASPGSDASAKCANSEHAVEWMEASDTADP